MQKLCIIFCHNNKITKINGLKSIAKICVFYLAKFFCKRFSKHCSQVCLLHYFLKKYVYELLIDRKICFASELLMPLDF